MSSVGFHVKYEIIDKSATTIAGPLAPPRWHFAVRTSSTAASPLARPQNRIRPGQFELGSLNYSEMFRRPWYHLRRHEYSPYFQDNWKVTPG